MGDIVIFPGTAPQNTLQQKAEGVVLSRLLFYFDSQTDKDLVRDLTPNDFQEPEHAAIFEAMKFLIAQGITTDIIAVGERLEETNKLEDAGGRNYLMDLGMCTLRDENMTEAVRYLQQQ